MLLFLLLSDTQISVFGELHSKARELSTLTEGAGGRALPRNIRNFLFSKSVSTFTFQVSVPTDICTFWFLLVCFFKELCVAFKGLLLMIDKCLINTTSFELMHGI